MQARPFSIKERERFRKIIGIMEGATIEGERKAARIAAERLAVNHGMSLEEATLECLPERDSGQESAGKRKERREAFHAWAARARMSEASERAERYRYEQARRAAEVRGLDREAPSRRQAHARMNTVYRPSGYRPSTEDRFRMIAGLLRDGASLRRAADLADVSTNEVARIWLLIRGSSQSRR